MILTYKLFLEKNAPDDDDFAGGGITNINIVDYIKNNDILSFKNTLPMIEDKSILNKCLFIACELEKKDIINIILSETKNYIDVDGYCSAISVTIKNNNVDLLEFLFKYIEPNYNYNYALRAACQYDNSNIVNYLLTFNEVNPTDYFYSAFFETSDKIINLMIDHPKVNHNKLFNVLLRYIQDGEEEIIGNEYLLKLLIRKYDILNPKYNNIQKLNPEDYDMQFELGLKKEYLK